MTKMTTGTVIHSFFHAYVCVFAQWPPSFHYPPHPAERFWWNQIQKIASYKKLFGTHDFTKMANKDTQKLIAI